MGGWQMQASYISFNDACKRIDRAQDQTATRLDGSGDPSAQKSSLGAADAALSPA